MKKIVSVFLAVALAPASSFAQEFGFGPKIGLNVAMVSGDVTEAPTPRMGLNAGAFAEYKFAGLWAVEGALMYSGQGVKDKWEPTSGVTVNTTTKVDYLNIPLVAKCYVAGGFNIFVGPQFGLLLSAKSEHEASNGDSQTDDLKDDCSGFAFSGVGGFGYQFGFGLNLSANFVFGFNDVLTGELDGVKYKNSNRVIQVTAGWKF